MNPVGKTAIELRIGDASETLECLDALQVAIQLAVAHGELATGRQRSINFDLGKIKTQLAANEVFEISFRLQIAAIPLGDAVIEGGWRSKKGQEIIAPIEAGAPNMAMAESIRASRESLSDLLTMSGREHLVPDELYRELKQAIDSAKGKKETRATDVALFKACQNGQVELVKELLAQGADVNARNERDETVLLHASEKGNLGVVNALLAAGADVNAAGNIGGTALMQACYFGHLGVVGALLHAGANLDAKNVDGTSALFMACVKGYLEIVKVLLAAGADANSKMNDGYTPLMRASRDGHIEILNELLAHGADLNARNNGGFTPLMLACAAGRAQVVKELIARGAETNVKSKNGDSASSLATSPEVRTLLGAKS